MKKQVKILSILLVFIMIVGLFSGCTNEKPTIDSLMQQFTEKSKEYNSISFTENLNIAMKMNILGSKSAMNMLTNVTIDQCNKDIHMAGSMAQKTVSNENTDTTDAAIDVYTLYNNDEQLYDTYIYNNQTNEFEHSQEEINNISESMAVNFKNLIGTNLVLKEEIEKYNNIDCYVINGTLDWLTIKESIKSLANSIESFTSVYTEDDLTMLNDLIFSMNYYFNKKSLKLEAITIDGAQSFEDILSTVMQKSIKKSIENEESAETINMDNIFSLSISKFEVILSNLQFNTITEIKLPENKIIIEKEENNINNEIDKSDNNELLNLIISNDWYGMNRDSFRFDEDGNWGWYDDESDITDNYTIGTYQFIFGEDALIALDTTYEQFGITSSTIEFTNNEKALNNFFILQCNIITKKYNGEITQFNNNEESLLFIGFLVNDQKVLSLFNLIDSSEYNFAKEDVWNDVSWENTISNMSNPNNITLAESFIWDDSYNTITLNKFDIILNQTLLQELLDTNEIILDTEYIDYIINENNSKYISCSLNTNTFAYLSFGIKNNTNTSKVINDLPITRVSINANEVNFNYCNLTNDSTLDDFITKFGNPTDYYHGSMCDYYTWESENWNTIELSIDLETNSLYNVEVSLSTG